MKQIIILLILLGFIFSCNEKSISESDKKQIISELNYIYSVDQEYSGIPPEKLNEKYGPQKAWEVFEKIRDSVSLENQLRIKKLYDKYGYLGYNEIGEEESHKFWITIQHADNDVEFQQKMLKELKKEISEDNASKANYAMLEDRVNINLNKKQRFGTQVTYNNYGQAIPKNGLIDSTNIEKIRKEFNLSSFKEYYNRMTTSHFKMNQKALINSGINEPKLYK